MRADPPRAPPSTLRSLSLALYSLLPLSMTILCFLVCVLLVSALARLAPLLHDAMLLQAHRQRHAHLLSENAAKAQPAASHDAAAASATAERRQLETTLSVLHHVQASGCSVISRKQSAKRLEDPSRQTPLRLTCCPSLVLPDASGTCCRSAGRRAREHNNGHAD